MPDKPLTPDELSELRDRLDEIDTGIIDLIAERLAVVKLIGDHKLRTGAPLRHYEREREVIERGVARAEEKGLSPRLAREMLETLIHHSIGDQETHQLAQSGHGQGARALVIGGLGRMGAWMARYLDTVGYQVDVADPVRAETPFTVVDDWESVIQDYDLVVVAVPLRPSNAVLHRLAELKPRGLVFDIGSLKSPMISGLEALAEARALFAHTAADCVDLSLEEHDEVMAWVLGLSHLVNIAFASALAESGEAVPLLRQISSSTFNAQLKVAAQVVSENPHLYYEIQQGNAMTGEVIGQFRRVLDNLARAIRVGDEISWTRAMEIANDRIGAKRG